MARQFFEIHDPTQVNRQKAPTSGPIIAPPCLSPTPVQHDRIGERCAALKVATQVEPAEVFWPAEDYHQDYYKKTGKAPYCHSLPPRFKD